MFCLDITYQVFKGVSIWDACKEGADIATKIDRIVSFIFNDIRVFCYPGKLWSVAANDYSKATQEMSRSK